MQAGESRYPPHAQRIAAEALQFLATGEQASPYSKRYHGFDLVEAYDVVAVMQRIRLARGETPVGRKIGLTNRAAWKTLGISAPIWNYMYDSTVREAGSDPLRFAVEGLAEPRVEPEIVLHLSATPVAGMDDRALIGCIDWIAHGFEIVHSAFPNWTFTAADAVAAHGLHGALLLGPRQRIGGERARWQKALSSFSIELAGDAGVRREGSAKDLLGGPLSALRCLVEDVARHRADSPIGAGELISTGSLTEAMPARAGERWSTRFQGLALGGLTVEFV
jgi:2-oxo-3-hexenedioate decarboxylase